jgi:hypothetical protein
VELATAVACQLVSGVKVETIKRTEGMVALHFIFVP